MSTIGIWQDCKDGDILIGGFNFGAGSSRERAAALKYRGILLVIAGSFNETYSNTLNGFLLSNVQKIVNDLKLNW